jgi:hypothetical protein
MGMQIDFARLAITPQSFVSEVQAFRAFVVNPALTPDDRKRAYGVIVKHATMLNPQDTGYEGAGVALKEACCSWLDSQPH